MPTPNPQDIEKLRKSMFESSANPLESWQVLLDSFEGFVSRTKAMGWSDEQARAIVFPQLVRIVSTMGTPKP